MADDALSDSFDARFSTVSPPPPVAASAPGVAPLTTMPTPLGPQPLPPPPPATAPTPPWVAGGGPVRPNMPGASPELNAVIAASTQTVEEQARRIAQRQAAQAPVIDAAMKQLDQPFPQRQPVQQPPPVPKREEILSGAEQWMMALATVAGVMGGRGRTHATNAMAAMTGAIEGLSEGNQQKFEQNMKQWDAENKRVQEINTASRNEYLDALNDRKLRQEEKNMAIQLIAQRYDDKAIQSLGGDWQRIAQMVQARDQLNQTKAEYEQGLRGIGSRFGAGARTMTDEALMLRVDQYLSGFPATTYQRGIKTGSADEARFSELAASEQLRRGISMDDLRTQQAGYAGSIAGGRSFGVRASAMRVLENDMAVLAPRAVKASEAVPRTNWVPLNRAIQMVQSGTASPALRRFVTANENMIDTWARELAPTGVPAQTLRNVLRTELETADSHEAYVTALDEIMQGIKEQRIALQRSERGELVEVPDLLSMLMNKSGAKGGIVRVQTPAEAQALAPGTHYLTPDGQERIR